MLYILCVIGSILVTIDVGYRLVGSLGDLIFSDSAKQISTNKAIIDVIRSLLVFAGWGYITYQVATRKYKWLKRPDKRQAR